MLSILALEKSIEDVLEEDLYVASRETHFNTYLAL